MIYGKIYDYFPTPNYSRTNVIFTWKNYLNSTWENFSNIFGTRLHSSRMRTARALTVSPSMLCAVGVSAPGDVSSPGGCLLPGGVSALGDVSALWRMMSALGGGVVSQHALRQTPPCEQNG